MNRPADKEIGMHIEVSKPEADLIVKGAYTQSRLRQMIFGGLTRHLILSCPIPVLFAH